mmetsp:Transcript_13965/g.34518  ORF Transcript_13965/g.34518 Transcript_13965/m.34518 type:complete len:185 (+) Transcript_13965:220-774(+)|eukprot:CAMPEP_0179003658 /NCGR_PEP_ID=MMETSP0795-20121207/12826_1 /TAXON_ID=88552 /ORGANISM="Amoebophrya sp., Strain Ameob2" /LENGTH=184 /DNA_ID=CAMNT_0020697743 /DNA_START=146 /DNA_END=703 /DNA_ORIENTATION=-
MSAAPPASSGGGPPAKDLSKIKTMGIVDMDTFLPMINTYLEGDFSDALQSFADSYGMEFKRLINEQVASQNFETHRHRYYDLFGVFRRDVEKSLADFCHSRRFKEDEFEATIDQFLLVESDEEGGEGTEGTEKDKKSANKAPLARECKRLIKAFIASTEYQAFMEFMVEYVGEMEESDCEETLC